MFILKVLSWSSYSVDQIVTSVMGLTPVSDHIVTTVLLQVHQ